MKRSLVLRVAIVMFCIASAAQTVSAAIVADGNVEPADPSTWTSSTWGYIGKTAGGSVTVDSGSDLYAYNGSIGYDSGVTGMVTVNGTGSTWTNSSSLYVGRYGNGTLNITGGGAVSNGYGYIDYYSGSTGVVTVDGTGSTWNNSSDLYVGREGSGTLNISGGGAVSNSSGYIGYQSGSTGTVTVAGTGSTWTNGGEFYVGNYGSGTLNITDGGTVVSNGNCYIGYDSGSTGVVTIDNGGALILKSLSKGSGTATFNFGGGTLQASDNFTTTLPMTLTGIGGNANVDTAGYAVTLSGQLSGTGGLNKLGTGTLTLTGSNNYAGMTILSSGSLVIGVNARSPIFDEGGVDIRGSDMAFPYTDPPDDMPALINAELTASYNGGAWNVGQFQCSTTSSTVGLGWKDDQIPTPYQVLVRRTLYGDADLNGTVEFADLSKVLTNYEDPGVWAEGDFNYDGTVDFADLSKVLSNYEDSVGLVSSGGGMGQGITAVPEPSSLVMLATLSALLGFWVARRSACCWPTAGADDAKAACERRRGAPRRGRPRDPRPRPSGNPAGRAVVEAGDWFFGRLGAVSVGGLVAGRLDGPRGAVKTIAGGPGRHVISGVRIQGLGVRVGNQNLTFDP